MQIKNILQELIGLKLTQTTRGADMECLKFGFKTNNNNQNIGEFGLHIQSIQCWTGFLVELVHQIIFPTISDE